MRLLFILALLMSFVTAGAQQIVGGSALCHVEGDPNLVLPATPDERYTCLKAVDVLSGTYYKWNFNSNAYEIDLEATAAASNNPPRYDKVSGDGFGSSLDLPSLDNISYRDKVVDPLGGTITGEAFLGATVTEKYLFASPQDADAVFRMNLLTEEFDTVRVQYGNVANPSRLRDKFNGCVYDGDFIYAIPSWSGPVVKIDPESLSILETYDVNTYGDDAYNGAVVVNNEEKIFFITHNAPTLRWLDKRTNTIGETDLSGIAGTSSGSRAFLSGCYDGKSLWMYPRASTKMLEIDPKTGAVIGEYVHPAAAFGPEPVGYFHGGTFDGRYIWFTPFNTDLLVWFDTVTKTYNSRPHGLPHVPNGSNDQFCLGSALIDGLVYFSRARATKDLVVNTIDQTHTLLDSNLPPLGGGSIAVSNGKIYIVNAGSAVVRIGDYSEDVQSVAEVRTKDLYVEGSAGVGGVVYFENGAPNPVPPDLTVNVNGVNFSGASKLVTQIADPFPTSGTILVDLNGASGNNKRILATASSFNSGDGVDFSFTGDGRIFLRRNGGVYVTPTGTTVGPTQRFAVTFGPSGFKFYRPGSSTALYTDTAPWSNYTNHAFNLTLGNTGLGDRPLEGEISELFAYNTVIPESEIINFINADIGSFSHGSPILNANFQESVGVSGGGIHISANLFDKNDFPGNPGDILTRSTEGGVEYLPGSSGGASVDTAWNYKAYEEIIVGPNPIRDDPNSIAATYFPAGVPAVIDLATGFGVLLAPEFVEIDDATAIGTRAPWRNIPVHIGRLTLTTDANGYIDIPHDVGSIPSVVTITSVGQSLWTATWDFANSTSTNIRIRVFDGVLDQPLANTPATISWTAYK